MAVDVDTKVNVFIRNPINDQSTEVSISILEYLKLNAYWDLIAAIRSLK